MRFEKSILTIRCDESQHSQTFYGDKVGECRRKARKIGWKLSNKKGAGGKLYRDLCPDCHKKWKTARIESRRKLENEKV